jgi:hypothetical protein
MVKSIQFMSIFLLSALAFARTEIPSIEAWIAQVDSKIYRGPGFIRSLILIADENNSNANKARKFLEVIGHKTYFKFISKEVWSFSRKLNVNRSLSEDWTSNESLAQILPFSGADTALVWQGNNGIMLKKWDGDRLSVQGGFSLPKSGLQNAKTFFKILLTYLGYDAIVVDYRHPFVLAQLVRPEKRLSQGLLIRDSDKLVRLGDSAKKGAALLQSLVRKDDFVVFEIMVHDGLGRRIKAGSKILLGRGSYLDRFKDF